VDGTVLWMALLSLGTSRSTTSSSTTQGKAGDLGSGTTSRITTANRGAEWSAGHHPTTSFFHHARLTAWRDDGDGDYYWL